MYHTEMQTSLIQQSFYAWKISQGNIFEQFLKIFYEIFLTPEKSLPEIFIYPKTAYTKSVSLEGI